MNADPNPFAPRLAPRRSAATGGDAPGLEPNLAGRRLETPAIADQIVRDEASFLRSPRGCYLTPAWGAWAPEPGLAILACWGPLRPADVDSAFRCLDAIVTHACGSIDYVSDWSQLRASSIDVATFGATLAGSSQRVEQAMTAFRRQAFVIPNGPIGAAVAGMNKVNGSRHAWRLFSTLADALVWFGRDDASALAARMSEIAANADQGSSLRVLVRSLLLETPKAPLPLVARKLGLSTRTLQRELRIAGTSFGSEQTFAATERAKQMLSETDAKIEAIGAAIGFSSPSHFSRKFKQLVGCPPGEYRTRAREHAPPG